MNVISIVKNDPVNSMTGFSTTIYLAGCEHHCKSCFSPQTWNYNQGEKYTIEELYNLLIKTKHKNVTFLGGDPFYPKNRNEVIDLIIKLKNTTNKIIYVWTGYSKEEIEKWINLELIDYLIEGKFILSQKDIRLNLRGSKNQRVFHKGNDITNFIDDIVI